MERFTFTVGKLDAGMAILIGDRAHLIEFPSLLLPPGVTSGSIVNISVNRNLAAEKAQLKDFWSLQDSILQEYGLDSPAAPELKLRHVTQTSVTLEWPALVLAKADVRSLEIFKNGERLATIPNPRGNTSTKLSSLQSNEEYTFQLVLKTTAGTYPSNIIRVRTHTMNDTSGISVCFGNVEDPTALSHAKQALEQMRAKWTDKIQIDTTHFVCTNAGPAGTVYGEGSMAPSPEFQKATQMSLPIVLPQWVLACHGERKLVPVSNYGLGSAPAQSNNAQQFVRRPSNNSRRNSMTEAAEQLGNRRAPSPETIARMSMNPTSPTLEAPSGSGSRQVGATPPENQKEVTGDPKRSTTAAAVPDQSAEVEQQAASPPRTKSPRPEANGKLDRRFKFPNSPSPPVSGSTSTFPTSSAETEVVAPTEVMQEKEKEEVVEPAALEKEQPENSKAAEPEVESTSTSTEPIKITEEPKSLSGTNEAAESPVASTSQTGKASHSESKGEEDDLKAKAKEWMERQNTVELDSAGHETKQADSSAQEEEEQTVKPSEVDAPVEPPTAAETIAAEPVPQPVSASGGFEEQTQATKHIVVEDVTEETVPISSGGDDKVESPDQVVPAQESQQVTPAETESKSEKKEIVDFLQDLEAEGGTDSAKDENENGNEDEDEADTPAGASTPVDPSEVSTTGQAQGQTKSTGTGKKNKKKGKKGK